MVFQVLISTLSKGPDQFRSFSFPVLVISQGGKGKDQIDQCFSFFGYEETGLSKSRNRALEKSEADIVLLADDDVQFVDHLEAKVIRAFEEFPDADVITFRVQTPEGLSYKNSYQEKEFQHTRSSIFKVSSVEIAVRASKIKASNIQFDERFGLGTQFKSGEEVIFLNDCLNAGLKLMYVPEVLVIHPLESSGKILDGSYFRSKGAIVKRLYGFTPLLGLGLLFILKQLFKKQKTISFAQSIMESTKGFMTNFNS